MGWERVWTQALVQFGAENIEARILIGLAVAFVSLMILEGLRASFRPAKVRRLAPPEPPVLVRTVTAQSKAAGAQPFRAHREIPRAMPKPVKRAVNRHQALRPKIRRDKSALRLPSFTEDALPYTPLSPKR